MLAGWVKCFLVELPSDLPLSHRCNAMHQCWSRNTVSKKRDASLPFECMLPVSIDVDPEQDAKVFNLQSATGFHVYCTQLIGQAVIIIHMKGC